MPGGETIAAGNRDSPFGASRRHLARDAPKWYRDFTFGHSGLFNQPLRGVGGQVVAQNPRKGFGPSRPLQPTPPRGLGPFSKVIQNRAKKYRTGRRSHFFFKQPLPRVFCPLNEPLRGVGGPTVAGPRAEGGRGEVNSPRVSPIHGLTRRTEGRRIFC